MLNKLSSLDLSVTILPLFSIVMVSFVRKPLLVRRGLTVFHNALLLAKPFLVTLRKYAFSNFRFIHYSLAKAMKGPWFPFTFLTFRDSCLQSINLNTLVKAEYISLLLYISPFSISWSRSWRKTVSLKFLQFLYSIVLGGLRVK